MNSNELLEDIQKEFKDFVLISKEKSGLMRAIDRFLRIVSFGQMTRFMTDYTTTIGTSVYTPSTWDARTDQEKCLTLRHERIHMRQARQYGFLWFSFLYLFCPLPIFLARFRAKFEMEAYEETIRALHEYYGVAAAVRARDSIVGQFTGSSYLWMWPFRSQVESWYDRTVEKVSSGG